MIRTLWVALAVAASTVFWGGSAIVASLLGRRGILYARLTRRWAGTILSASGSPVVVHGIENVRPDRPVVVVSNHVSWFDVFAIASVMPGAFHFVAKKELESIPVFGSAWKAAGHISIDRTNRQSAIHSLREAGQKIREERGAVVIFPEGTRSRTGRLQPFKKGAFMLAVEAGVPVVPTVVVGSYDIMRPDTWKIHPNTIHIHFCEPIVTHGARSADADVLMDGVRARMVEILGDTDSLPPLECAG